MDIPAGSLLRYDHIVIATRNPEQLLDFYGRLPCISTAREGDREVIRIGAQKINVHHYPSALSPLARHPVIGSQSFCLALACDGVDLENDLRRDGIVILKDYCPPEPLNHSAINDFQIEDPDKNLIRIMACPTMQPALTTLNLSVGNMAASLKLYCDFLGMACRHVWAGSYICSFGASQLRLCANTGIWAAGSCDFCIIANGDLEEIRNGLKNAPLVPGLGIVERNGALGPMHSLYLRDPDGNLVEIAVYD